MKKLFTFITMLVLSLSVQAANFKEGVNYTVLNLPASQKPLVSEYFSFYCPHCFNFEPFIQQLKTQLPKDATFQKNHVSFMGGALGNSMSKAYATMVSLNVENKMLPAMFERIHVQNNAPKNNADIRQLFIDNGVDAKQFDATFDSFAVDSMVRRFDKQFTDSGLQGVPAIIVNNHYLIKAESINSAEEYIELVKFLLTK